MGDQPVARSVPTNDSTTQTRGHTSMQGAGFEPMISWTALLGICIVIIFTELSRNIMGVPFINIFDSDISISISISIRSDK